MQLFLLTCLILFENVNSVLHSDWLAYKSLYKKYYDTKEDKKRRMIWEENMLFIESHNVKYYLGQTTFLVEMNKYGDLKTDEFIKLFSFDGLNKNSKTQNPDFVKTSSDLTSLPDSVDWRKQGYVTKVKNQLSSPSGWAFAAVGALEGQIYKKNRKLIQLSEQNILDCSIKHNATDLSLGTVYHAYDYIKSNLGLANQAAYPFRGIVKKINYLG